MPLHNKSDHPMLGMSLEMVVANISRQYHLGIAKYSELAPRHALPPRS